MAATSLTASQAKEAGNLAMNLEAGHAMVTFDSLQCPWPCPQLGLRQMPEKVTISPNPANLLVTVRVAASAETQEAVSIRVLDLQGREMPLEFTHPREEEYRFDVQRLAAGMYLVELRRGNTLRTEPLLVK